MIRAIVKALFYPLCSRRCYRYWGQGIWTDYGRELCRRAEGDLTHDFDRTRVNWGWCEPTPRNQTQ